MMPRFICCLLIYCGALVSRLSGICAWQRSVRERKVFRAAAPRHYFCFVSPSNKNWCAAIDQ